MGRTDGNAIKVADDGANGGTNGDADKHDNGQPRRQWRRRKRRRKVRATMGGKDDNGCGDLDIEDDDGR